jgi:hypothetical protein
VDRILHLQRGAELVNEQLARALDRGHAILRGFKTTVPPGKRVIPGTNQSFETPQGHQDLESRASTTNASLTIDPDDTATLSQQDLTTSSMRPTLRFLAYGVAGWAVDSLFVAAHTGRRRPSSLLNVLVSGLAHPLFEPVHDRLRQRPLALRAVLYSAGTLGVEYSSGRLLRRLVGYAPWDYGRARFAIDGLVRLDYLPLWAAFGLGLERLHDLLDTHVSAHGEKTRCGSALKRDVLCPVPQADTDETLPFKAPNG